MALLISLTKTLSMKQNTLKKDIRDFRIDMCVLVYRYIQSCNFSNFLQNIVLNILQIIHSDFAGCLIMHITSI